MWSTAAVTPAITPASSACANATLAVPAWPEVGTGGGSLAKVEDGMLRVELPLAQRPVRLRSVPIESRESR